MPDGISLQMQDLFFLKLFFFLVVSTVLFFPDLFAQNKTSSRLSQPESDWQDCGWQLCLKLLSSFSFSKLSDMFGIYHPLHSQLCL